MRLSLFPFAVAALVLVAGCGPRDEEPRATDTIVPLSPADTTGTSSAAQARIPTTTDTSSQSTAQSPTVDTSATSPAQRTVPEPDDRAKIDAWLAAHSDSLNEYGDPKGTMYTGGTPLYLEAEGRMISKYEYIRMKHPDKPWDVER